MAKVKRQEMWWVILAKSKTLRFFAVSCEFILFLGGLWITFTVNDPSAKTWFSGNVNMIFLTVMGWAIDAAMPEAWLHVVIQHVQKEKGQIGWSKFVACAISVLFIGNIIYSILSSGDTANQSTNLADGTTWILLLLTILRITVGFVYLTVRQCQEWIKRQSEPQDANIPPALEIDSWALVGWAAKIEQIIEQIKAELQSQIAELSSKHQSALVNLVSEQRLAEHFDVHVHKFNLMDLQMQRVLSEIQALQSVDISIPTVDYDALTQRVLTHLRADFDVWKQAQVDALPDASQPQIDAPKHVSSRRQKDASKPKHDASTKILTMRQPSASTTDKKERIHALLEQDVSLSSYYLGKQVGCSEATARRIKNEWIDTHHDASDSRNTDAVETIVLTHDALRQDA